MSYAMTANNWIVACEKLPDDSSPKELMGVMTCQGIWDKEGNTWRLIEDSKINCEVRQWKEIDNGSTEQKDAAS